MTDMKACRHCRYSIGTINGLWCQLHERPATRACWHFEREPGSDDDE